MTDSEGLDPRKHTFSQAQGYEPIPGPLALEQLSDEARVKLWDSLVFFAWDPFPPSDDPRYWDTKTDWVSIFQMLHSEFVVRPRDEFEQEARVLVELYRPAILHNLPFNKLFDLFQMIMRHPDCPSDFTLNVAAVFKQCRLAYVVDIEQPVTILPAATQQEGEAIIGAIKELREAGLHGAETHLKKAGELINEGDWPGAVRESINAVESVARAYWPQMPIL